MAANQGLKASSEAGKEMDVGTIFTADESEGARSRFAGSSNDSAEASYITFITPILIFIFRICISQRCEMRGSICVFVESAYASHCLNA